MIMLVWECTMIKAETSNRTPPTELIKLMNSAVSVDGPKTSKQLRDGLFMVGLYVK